jgi:hypothetical protein
MQTLPTSPDKDNYKVRNWRVYTASLRQRGSISLWLEDSVLRAWREVDLKKKVVGEATYPDCVIVCCLVLGLQYHQKLRQTQGLVQSILALLGKGHYAVPDYTTLSRRAAGLPVEVSKRWQAGENIALALASTGLKVYGEGEWKVRKHGVSKHRTWRKLHIGIDLATQEIISVELTTNAESDGETARRIVKGKTTQLKSFTGDGGYDDFGLRALLGQRVRQVIPPPVNAVLHPTKGFLQQRNEAITAMQSHSRKQWKQQVGYHQRSRNEVAMFRFKTTFTHQLKARKLVNQQTEVNIKCKILNTYRKLGMPIAYKVV